LQLLCVFTCIFFLLGSVESLDTVRHRLRQQLEIQTQADCACHCWARNDIKIADHFKLIFDADSQLPANSDIETHGGDLTHPATEWYKSITVPCTTTWDSCKEKCKTTWKNLFACKITGEKIMTVRPAPSGKLWIDFLAHFKANKTDAVNSALVPDASKRGYIKYIICANT